MSNLDIIRAWKDAQYRNTLSDEEKALLPEHPAGRIELTDTDLQEVDGGTTGVVCLTVATVTVTFAYCTSFVQGGSCDFGTSGCCSHQTCVAQGC